MNASCAEAPPNLAVALPSRLYYPPRADKPLNGLRIAIKDNIDISGAKTSGSCKSFGNLYGVRSHSAPAVQRLIDLGAVILGKTGMSQFADAEDPSGDFVDFHAPRNPRGDGLRVAGGSSFGSGAAAGAYDWIDFTLGTDSNTYLIQSKPLLTFNSWWQCRPTRGTSICLRHPTLEGCDEFGRHVDYTSVRLVS